MGCGPGNKYTCDGCGEKVSVNLGSRTFEAELALREEDKDFLCKSCEKDNSQKDGAEGGSGE